MHCLEHGLIRRWKVGGMSSRSLPALNASTAARPILFAKRCVSPAISSASVTIIPLKAKLLFQQIGNDAAAKSSPRGSDRDPAPAQSRAPPSPNPPPPQWPGERAEVRPSRRARSTLTLATPRCESVAVSPCPGKCFTVVEHPAFMRALDVGGDHIPDLLGILSKRARVDDGIRRVGVHVGVGEKIPVHPNGPRLQSSDAAEIFGILNLAVRPERHRVREVRAPVSRIATPRSKSAANKQRQLGFALQPVQQFRRFVGPLRRRNGPSTGTLIANEPT